MNDGMEPHLWWLIVAILLAGAELLVPGAFLIWIAAALTAWTGWDYFIKALPYLKDSRRDG